MQFRDILLRAALAPALLSTTACRGPAGLPTSPPATDVAAMRQVGTLVVKLVAPAEARKLLAFEDVAWVDVTVFAGPEWVETIPRGLIDAGVAEVTFPGLRPGQVNVYAEALDRSGGTLGRASMLVHVVADTVTPVTLDIYIKPEIPSPRIVGVPGAAP